MTHPLTQLQPVPEPRQLDSSYERHAPSVASLRDAIKQTLDGIDWEGLPWVDVIEALVAIGRTDIPLSRLVEGHVDALRIFAQAGATPQPDALYGVWASRSQATGASATPQAHQLILNGTIRFASGTHIIDRSLVPVWLPDGSHLLVDLPLDGLPVDDSAWHTSAMQVSRSHTVTVAGIAVDATTDVVGDADFYLSRPGFFPGGVGVAAVWAGNAARVLDLLLDYVQEAPPSAARDVRLGQMRTDLAVCAALVRQAAQRLDTVLPTDGTSWTSTQLQELATEARAGVGDAVNRLLGNARRVAGPAGLAYAAALTHAIDDLALYVLQQNADSDAAFLGQSVTQRD